MLLQKKKLDLWLKDGQNGVIDTELYLAHVSTRCIFLIDSPEFGGQMALVFIGMTEISSCTMEKQAGDQVSKGDELGRFQFGGSSGLMLLSKDIVDKSGKGANIFDGVVDHKWKMCQKVIEL